MASAPKFFITGEVTVQVTDSEAQYPGNPGQFTLYRPAGCTNETLTVYFTMDGTEVENTDYTLSSAGNATLEAGATSKTINLTATMLGQGTAILKLTPATSNAYPVGADSNATVTIRAAALTDFAAVGGSVTNYATNGTNYTVHIFAVAGTTGITFTASGDVDVLVVAGGGAGGKNRGGGGGGGGVIYSQSLMVTSGLYSVTVGAGGTGGTNVTPASGSNSVFGNLVAIGGGVGGNTWAGGATGGSGGGGGIYAPPTHPTVNGGAGTSGQGYAGGNAYTTLAGGGGGGANQVGGNGTNTGVRGGQGGVGTSIAITGVSVIYGSGGGGGGYGGPGGAGGVGGGGAGAAAGSGYSPATNAVAGRPNTGGGGGGGTDDDIQTPRYFYGAAGGSGIVIVRYVTSPYEQWRRAHFTAGELAEPEISGGDADPDHDNFSNLKEYLAGTNPTNAASVLAFSKIEGETGGAVLRWQSATGKTYSIVVSTNPITDLFTNSVITGLLADPPENVYTDTVERIGGVFYRIGLDQ